MENKRPQRWNTRDFCINMCTFKNLVLSAQPCRIYPIHLELRGNRCSGNVKMEKMNNWYKQERLVQIKPEGPLCHETNRPKTPWLATLGVRFETGWLHFSPVAVDGAHALPLIMEVVGRTTLRAPLRRFWKLELGLDDFSGQCSVYGNVERQQGWAQHVKGPPRWGCAVLQGKSPFTSHPPPRNCCLRPCVSLTDTTAWHQAFWNRRWILGGMRGNMPFWKVIFYQNHCLRASSSSKNDSEKR